MPRPRSRTAPWRDPKIRGLIAQAVVLTAVVLGVWWLGRNAAASLARQKIASGFEFLDHTAGFGIIQTLIDYTEQSSYGDALIVGLLNTVLVAVIGIVLATAMGFLLGVARLSRNWLIAKLAAAYVEIVRNVPLLLQIVFWYGGVLRALPGPRQSLTFADVAALNNRGLFVPRFTPEAEAMTILIAALIGVAAALGVADWAKRRQLRTGRLFPTGRVGLALVLGLPLLAAVATGFPFAVSIPELKGFNYQGGIQILPELMALTLALAIYTASYIGEIVRSGIEGVPRGQSEAAAALGLKHGLALRLVVLPQALRIIVPPLTSQYLNLTKNSSLAVAVGYPDLVAVFAGTVLNQTGQAIEVLAITMALYLALSLLTSALMNWYNRAYALKGG